MKKLIAILLGIEAGLLLVILAFTTLIGYLIAGILAYIFGFIIPIEHNKLHIAFNYIIMLTTIGTSIFVCLKLSNKYFHIFKWAVIILFPVCYGLIYYTF